MDVEHSALNPVKVDVEPKSFLHVVNPNVDYVHEDTIGGKVYKFDPLIVYAIPEKQAAWLVMRAEEQYVTRKANAQEQMDCYLKLVEHPDPFKRSKAPIYCDIVDGNPIPKSQPPPRVGLIRMDNIHGRKLYEEGLAEYKARHESVAKQSLTPDTPPPAALPLDVHADPEESILTVYSPDTNWTPEKKIAYIKEFSPNKRIYTRWKDNPSGLDKQTMDVFEERKHDYERLGIRYNISRDYKPKELGG